MIRRGGRSDAWVIGLLVLVGHLPAWAGTDDERTKLQAEKRAVEQAYVARLKACETEFAVNSCRDDARLHRRDALLPIQSRLADLDAASRRARAQERQRAIDAKMAQLPDRPASAAGPAPGTGRGDPTARATRSESPAAPPPTSPANAVRSQGEARARARFELRRRQGEEHVREVQVRQETRARTHKKAAPLPLPSGDASGATAPKTPVPLNAGVPASAAKSRTSRTP